MNIFILDDDPSFAKLLQLKLKAWRSDLSFAITTTIADAQTTLTGKTDFALAILDHHLPDGLGNELFDHPSLEHTAVLAVSSDEAPEIPAKSVKAGAQHFLTKRQITEPLFIPLLDALIERKALERELLQQKLNQHALESIKVLVATLEHEINNPLGAVIGGAFLIRSSGELDDEQKSALKLIEESGNRIKHVIKQLRSATELDQVTKGNVATYHIPGDKPWKK